MCPPQAAQKPYGSLLRKCLICRACQFAIPGAHKHMNLGIGAEFLQEMQHYVATAIGNGVRRPLKIDRTPSAECTRTHILLPLPAKLQCPFMTPSATFLSRARVL